MKGKAINLRREYIYKEIVGLEKSFPYLLEILMYTQGYVYPSLKTTALVHLIYS